jgi:hypothetical protein
MWAARYSMGAWSGRLDATCAARGLSFLSEDRSHICIAGVQAGRVDAVPEALLDCNRHQHPTSRAHVFGEILAMVR